MNAALIEPFRAKEVWHAVKGLSTLLNAANKAKILRGATVGCQRLEVGHLLFVDDSVLFSEASIVAANTLKQVLITFGNASGHRVNFEKSLVFYSGNVDEELRNKIGSLLGVHVSSNPEKYLGLPTMVGRRKRDAFSYYFDRFNVKTENWGIHFLSTGGKESVNCNYMLVSDLIDASTATWKVDILESLFDEVHVNKIRAIPLSKTRLQDKLVWRYDGLGSYTVKSGYRLLNGELNAALLLSADSGVNFSRFYAALWSSNLPPKVNIAMWRIINNYMPTLVNLRFRQLTVDVCCPLCKSTEESIEHIMRECAFVKQILDAQGVRCSVPVADLSWKECLAQTFVSLSMRQRQALMITFYSVWYTRNQVLHEGLAPSVSSSISFVEAFLSEHDLFNSQASPRPLRLHDNWVAPAMSVIKLNFDASYDASPGKFVSGVLCRDNDGFILVACSKPHSHVADPFQAEALACLVAVTFAKDLGFTRVIVEGDSFTIIKKCASEAIDVSLVSPVVADIKR
ncbi:hypothetical protein V6N13_106985 [Hibiscus sabdariffa]